MKRMIVTWIAAALLAGLPGAALAGGAGGGAEGEPSKPVQRDDARPDAEREAAGGQRASDLPIYIPPSRGSLPTRVGGGSRGGQQPRRGL